MLLIESWWSIHQFCSTTVMVLALICRGHFGVWELFPLSVLVIKPSGCSTHYSSWRYTFRNGDFTSSWCIFHFFCAAKAMRAQIVSRQVKGVKVLLKFILGCYKYPFAMSHVLCFWIDPSAFSFSCAPFWCQWSLSLGQSTSSQVSFFSFVSIYSSAAFISAFSLEVSL